MRIGNTEFTIGQTKIFGILNITPDSFSDGGKYISVDAALKRVQEMIEEGADVIDVGGESSRPGYTPVPSEIQIERIVPVIEKIKKEFDIPVSVDTTEFEVASESLNAGADLINDICGNSLDEKLGGLIAKRQIPCVLMHNGAIENGNLSAQLKREMKEIADRALLYGIEKNKIILDPGVGFGKTTEQNLEIIKNLKEYTAYDCPVLLGSSRKSVIGNTLSLPVEERLEGTLATTVMAVLNGAMFVRVHDVKENYRVIKMTEAILGK